MLAAADPARIRALVAATKVFSPEEVRTAANLAETTLDGSETYRWLIAEREGQLVGYTCFDRIPFSKVSFDLYWIAVSHELWGLGRELMARTVKFIKTKRGLSIFAETSSRDAHGKARTFYEAMGFRQVARFDDYYDIGDAKITYRLVL